MLSCGSTAAKALLNRGHTPRMAAPEAAPMRVRRPMKRRLRRSGVIGLFSLSSQQCFFQVSLPAFQPLVSRWLPRLTIVALAIKLGKYSQGDRLHGGSWGREVKFGRAMVVAHRKKLDRQRAAISALASAHA